MTAAQFNKERTAARAERLRLLREIRKSLEEAPMHHLRFIAAIRRYEEKPPEKYDLPSSKEDRTR